MARTAKPRRIEVHVLTYPGSSIWAAGAVVEALELAAVFQRAKGGEATLAVHWTSARGAVVATTPQVTVRAPRPAARPDVLVVPPYWHATPQDFEERLPGFAQEVAFIRSQADQGSVIASVCSGAALLGRAGLLDGRSATACWWLEQSLRRLFPATRWQMASLLVHDGPIVTAGAGQAYTRLIHDLIEQAAGRSLAARVAQFIGIEPNRDTQSPFVDLVPAHVQGDPWLEPLVRAIRARPSREWDVEALAALARTSPRTLVTSLTRGCGGDDVPTAVAK